MSGLCPSFTNHKFHGPCPQRFAKRINNAFTNTQVSEHCWVCMHEILHHAVGSYVPLPKSLSVIPQSLLPTNLTPLFYFTLMLPSSGRTGEAWELSYKIMLFLHHNEISLLSTTIFPFTYSSAFLDFFLLTPSQIFLHTGTTCHEMRLECVDTTTYSIVLKPIVVP